MEWTSKNVPLVPLPCDPCGDSFLKLVHDEITAKYALPEAGECEVAEVLTVSTCIMEINPVKEDSLNRRKTRILEHISTIEVDKE
jgi:hypothetical protein